MCWRERRVLVNLVHCCRHDWYLCLVCGTADKQHAPLSIIQIMLYTEGGRKYCSRPNREMKQLASTEYEPFVEGWGSVGQAGLQSSCRPGSSHN